MDLSFYKGKFITFEGGEGTGKTTISNRLYEEFKKQNIPVVKTFDPGGCDVAKKIREIIVSKKYEVSKIAEMLLFFAARVQLEHEVVIPALKNGKTVISDRWFDSTFVYQGLVKGNDINFINQIFINTCRCRPFLTFFMDVDPKEGLKRSYKVLSESGVDESKFEDYGLEFHKKVRDGFLFLYENQKNFLDFEKRIQYINANESLDLCEEEMYEILEMKNNMINEFNKRE